VGLGCLGAASDREKIPIASSELGALSLKMQAAEQTGGTGAFGRSQSATAAQPLVAQKKKKRRPGQATWGTDFYWVGMGSQRMPSTPFGSEDPQQPTKSEPANRFRPRWPAAGTTRPVSA